MIVLLLTPEEGGQIRDLLPPGALKDYISGKVAVELIPAPIPELVIWRPNWNESGGANGQGLHIYDEELAKVMVDAVLAVWRREKISKVEVSDDKHEGGPGQSHRASALGGQFRQAAELPAPR